MGTRGTMEIVMARGEHSEPYLDPLLQVLLKVSTVHDAILHRVGAVNEQLDLVLLPQLLDSLALSLQLLLARLCLLLLCDGHRGHRYSEIGSENSQINYQLRLGPTSGKRS